MYDYLCANGDCYYIEYQGKLVGDVSLQENGEVAIVVAKDYQNLHIGRRCIREMLRLAAGKGMESVKARIYEFNEQSRHMFLTAGFKQISEEWFECACEKKIRFALAGVGFKNGDMDHNKKRIVEIMREYGSQSDLILFGETFFHDFFEDVVSFFVV